MPSINELVESAYRGDRASVEKCLLANIDVNGRAAYQDNPGIASASAFKFYPYISRIRRLHTKTWSCSCWRKENLRNFTPLAAAIFGQQSNLVSMLLDKCQADIQLEIRAHSYSSDGYQWGEYINKLNPLGLALIVGNQEIIRIVCKYLQEKNLLPKMLKKDIEMSYYSDVQRKVKAIDIPLVLKDSASLKTLLGYINPLNFNDIFTSFITPRDKSLAQIKTLVVSMVQLSSKDVVINSILEGNLIWTMANSCQPDVFEFLTGLLSDEQAKAVLNLTPVDNGNALLHNAVILQSVSWTKAWLEEGADPNLPNNEGNTALHLALVPAPCNSAIVQLLIDHGAKTDIKNTAGKTPMDLCRQPFIAETILTQRAQVKNGERKKAGDTEDHTTPMSFGCNPFLRFSAARKTKPKLDASVEYVPISSAEQNKLVLS